MEPGQTDPQTTELPSALDLQKTPAECRGSKTTGGRVTLFPLLQAFSPHQTILLESDRLVVT